jgi:tRNA pseudouridine38-40 synthase
MSHSQATYLHDAGQRRVALLLEYDGGAYAGSQLQTNARTVQFVLEEAISKATQEKARVAFAGRTDAGVHARGQVASFVTTSALDQETIVRALNAWLPPDVVVREVAEVPSGFDVRRDARRRHYRYLVDNRRTRPALERDRVWQVAPPLDVEEMAAAARTLVGRHDFAAFASPLEDEGSTLRDLYRFDVTCEGELVTFDVVANAFLPHQVRRMAGALVEVGKGRRSAEEYRALLDGPAASAGPTAPAHGLYLMEVEYVEPLFRVGQRESVSAS